VTRAALPNRRGALVAGLGLTVGLVPPSPAADAVAAIRLTPPVRSAAPSVPAAMAARRSVRRYASQALPLEQLSQLLWAGQGISGDQGLRTAPSAGALYPLELRLAARRVSTLGAGIYRYLPASHAIEAVVAGEPGAELAAAAGGQAMVGAAPVVLAIVARHAITAAKYGARAERYVAIEAGAAAQNIALQAVSLGLGTVIVGAFDDDALAHALRLPAHVRPLALMPVGVPA
jgi:SagB-type dehydrogenase family enzyme